MKNLTCAIVGGGIVGLACAYELSHRGADVTLFDQHIGKGATFAAAGMIAPGGEITPGEYEGFLEQSKAPAAWQSWVHRLQREIGETPTLTDSGTLMVGWDRSDNLLLERHFTVAKDFKSEVCWVDRSSHSELFSTISHRIDRGLFFASDNWLEPDQIVACITKALLLRGVRLVEQPVDDLSIDGRVVVENESFAFDHVVCATGSSGSFPSMAFTSHVRPVRGSTVLIGDFEVHKSPMIRAFVRGNPFYFVNRGNGSGVIGATSEEDASAHAQIGEIQRLFRDALDVIPSLETARIREIRSGLRPASATGNPFIESFNEGRVLWVSGHYRHGVTLAPLTAQDIGERICPN